MRTKAVQSTATDGVNSKMNFTQWNFYLICELKKTYRKLVNEPSQNGDAELRRIRANIEYKNATAQEKV